MSLSNEEIQLIQEAMGVYIQLAAQQMPQSTVEALSMKAKEILEKLPTLGVNNGDGPANKPANISDEWFENVCTGCDKLTPTGCSDTVTQKFPGKCDPILKYEMNKRLSN